MAPHEQGSAGIMRPTAFLRQYTVPLYRFGFASPRLTLDALETVVSELPAWVRLDGWESSTPSR
jgi:hypothetical protein